MLYWMLACLPITGTGCITVTAGQLPVSMQREAAPCLANPCPGRDERCGCCIQVGDRLPGPASLSTSSETPAVVDASAISHLPFPFPLDSARADALASSAYHGRPGSKGRTDREQLCLPAFVGPQASSADASLTIHLSVELFFRLHHHLGARSCSYRYKHARTAWATWTALPPPTAVSSHLALPGSSLIGRSHWLQLYCSRSKLDLWRRAADSAVV